MELEHIFGYNHGSTEDDRVIEENFDDATFGISHLQIHGNFILSLEVPMSKCLI